jgi:hypothetical protein
MDGELIYNLMKKFSKIYEGLKDPIDPTADVEDFKEVFYDNIPLHLQGINQDKIDKILKKITDEHPTMTESWNVYRVYNIDEDESDTIMYVKAISEDHAKIRASILSGNIQYSLYYYFKSSIMHEKYIKLKLDELEEEIEMLKNPK